MKKLKSSKWFIGFWWVLILSIILGAIIGASLMYYLRIRNFIVLAGWAAAGLEIFPVLVVFFQLNLQRNKESLVEQNKDISARPRPSFRYLNKLNLGQTVYYNKSSLIWLNKTKHTMDPYMMNLKKPKKFKGRKKIGFITSDRFGPTLLGIRNISNHDMYDCKVTMIYACGSEVTNVLEKNHSVDKKKLNQQIHTEYIEIPVIEARQEIAIVNYPRLLGVPFLMVTLKITYGTERGEVLETVFASEGEENEIIDYTSNTDGIAKTRKLTVKEMQAYQNFIHHDNRVVYGVNDFVRDTDKGLNDADPESKKQSDYITSSETTHAADNSQNNGNHSIDE